MAEHLAVARWWPMAAPIRTARCLIVSTQLHLSSASWNADSNLEKQQQQQQQLVVVVVVVR